MFIDYLFPHHARQLVQERGGELGAQQAEARVVGEGVLVLGQHRHHGLDQSQLSTRARGQSQLTWLQLTAAHVSSRSGCTRDCRM